MHERLQSPQAKRMKVQRSSTVEPVLGSLINFTGMRRIWTRGIKNANKFVLGAAIAYNLKKWINWQEINKKLTCNKQTKVEKPVKSALSSCISLCLTFRTFEKSRQILMR